MIITVEYTAEEKQALKAMTEKAVVRDILLTDSKAIIGKGPNMVEVKPAFVVATAKLVEYAAPLLASMLCVFKSTLEAIKPYIEEVKKAEEA